MAGKHVFEKMNSVLIQKFPHLFHPNISLFPPSQPFNSLTSPSRSSALPRPHGARPDPLSLPVQAALPLGAGAFLTPLLSRRAMCFTTRQSQFRGDTENLKAAAGVSGKAAEVGARARA
eukprot:1338888-Amorphochlora_amoeboformis.AAC.1